MAPRVAGVSARTWRCRSRSRDRNADVAAPLSSVGDNAPRRALRDGNFRNDARPIVDALSLDSVLGQGACPIALLAGALDVVERSGRDAARPYRAPPDTSVAGLGPLFQQPGDRPVTVRGRKKPCPGLRTASLARRWRDQHRAAEARELLGSVYRRFTEGFNTADLRVGTQFEAGHA
jgi:hypothetical protein